MQRNPLFELAHPLFASAKQFAADCEKESSIPSTWRDNLVAKFQQFEQLGQTKQIPLTLIQHAKYALAAFIDELVMLSNWDQNMQWMANPLQSEFFGEHLAGEGFFKRLAQLRQYAQQNIDVLEIYFMCMQLGFCGIYQQKGQEAFQALQVELRSQIDSVRGGTNPKLAPQAVPKGFVSKISREVPLWVIASVTTAIIICAYLGFTLTVNHQANTALKTIQTATTQLKSEEGNGHV